MDRMLYVAMTGANQVMRAQRVTSNNLANVHTTGFRADLAAFDGRPVEGAGFPSRVNAQLEGLGSDLAPGSFQTTGRELDVAVQGEGWLAVQAPDGTESYTRAGDLRLDTVGMLTTGAGHPVIGDGGPVAIPPHQQLTIGGDGTVSIVPLGQTAQTLVVVDRIKLVNPPAETLEKGDDGLFRSTDADTAPADASVKLVAGALEGSNVSAAGAMVEMIELSRLFEVQVKLLDTARDMADAAGTVMRTR